MEIDQLLDKRDNDIQDKLETNKKVIDAIHNQHQKAHDSMVNKKQENREIRDMVAKDKEEKAKRLHDEMSAQLAVK